MQLDDLDRKILSMLQVDGRRAYTSIAQELGISEGVVRYRAQRLTKAGIMQVVAVTNPLKVGYNLLFMVLIKVKPGQVRRVSKELTELKAVNFLAVMAGGACDIMAEVISTSAENFNAFLLDELQAIEGIVATESQMILDIQKLDYGWGFDALEAPAASDSHSDL